MTYREFRDLPRFMQKKVISNYIDRENETFIKNGNNNDKEFLSMLISKGHSEKLHIAQEEDDLLSRVMLECKPCSSFDNYDELKWNVLKNIEEYLDEIVEWLVPNTFARQDKIYENQLVVECPALSLFTEEPLTCKGIDTDFNVKETEDATLILERNRVSYADDRNFFFYIKTIYPDIQTEYSCPTGRNLSNKAKDFLDNGIKVGGERVQLPELQKAYWTLKLMGCRPYAKNINSEKPLIYVPFEINDTQFSVLLSPETKYAMHASVNAVTGRHDDGSFAYMPLRYAMSINTETKEMASEFADAVRNIYDKAVADKNIDYIMKSSQLNMYNMHSEYAVDYTSSHLGNPKISKEFTLVKENKMPTYDDYAYR